MDPVITLQHKNTPKYRKRRGPTNCNNVSYSYMASSILCVQRGELVKQNQHDPNPSSFTWQPEISFELKSYSPMEEDNIEVCKAKYKDLYRVTN